jgi:hypothetical protein
MCAAENGLKVRSIPADIQHIRGKSRGSSQALPDARILQSLRKKSLLS